MDADDDGATTGLATTRADLHGDPVGEAATELAPGRMLAGDRYRIGGSIGRGGMGSVHAARDVQLAREVAVKRLSARNVTDHKLQRFMREVSIQGRLEHPAIVPVYELGVDAEGVPFFVMKKVAGTTLAKLVAGGGATRQSLLRAFTDICLAVEFAHTRGFVHRDLKPDNIVLGEFGEVYVLDWGIAKVIGVHEDSVPGEVDELATRDGVVVGTPGYMAPEQVRGESTVDARTDVYALGCLLFEILAGERLHPGGNPGLVSAIAGIDARPSQRVPVRDIPPELDEACVRATELDPDHRFSTARALAEHVQRFLDGDRDLALRRRLAREHLDAATAAFAGDSDDERRLAMRLAGRALALDPMSAGAAELVGRLMLEPPRVVPREVRRAVAADAELMAQRAARSGMWGTFAYVVMMPLLFLEGFRTPIYPIALTALIALNLGLLWWRSVSSTSSLPSVLGVFVLIAMVGRMFSPFVVTPGIAAVSGVAILFGLTTSSVRSAIALLAGLSGAVLLPWIAEVTGLVSRTIRIEPHGLVMEAPGLAAPSQWSTVLLVGYAVALIGAGIVVATQIRRSEAAARERLHLQAWQLRQLVPSPA